MDQISFYIVLDYVRFYPSGKKNSAGVFMFFVCTVIGHKLVNLLFDKNVVQAWLWETGCCIEIQDICVYKFTFLVYIDRKEGSSEDWYIQ
jgi:hypothetical protein